MRKKVGHGLTDIDDGEPTMPGIPVPLERTTDEGDLGQNTEEDADSEDAGDEKSENQELPEAVWALIRARASVLEASEVKRRRPLLISKESMLTKAEATAAQVLKINLK